MNIGTVKLVNRVIAAPVAGVSDRSFRILAREAGCGLVYTEMISAQALQYGNKKTLQMVDFKDEQPPLSVQIFGSNAAYMARAAEIVADRGAAIIDINMGCPAPKIVKNNEGCALMKDVQLAAQIVAAVVKQVNIPVTVKMRKGWDEEQVNAVELALCVEQAGASAVAIHGRTRGQFYSGKADWEIIRQVKEAVKIPVIGNGDIGSAVDAGRMLQATGCDAIMIARAALGNPWIFKQTVHYLETGAILPDPGPLERVQMAIRHLKLMVADKGEYTGVTEMRKHAAWYTKGLCGAAALRQRINQSQTTLELETILLSVLL
ncbi:tRNA dihydrouridine synthase DusB [Peptococcaceae bacterium]|nr:tRNA dihydrouridine synthase DusB [Peptococcaceae bacterium]